MEVTDPGHPLFGQRFLVHRVTTGDIRTARVHVHFRGEQRLMIFREATNLSVLERLEPQSKLSASVVKEFLALVKDLHFRRTLTG